MNPPPSLLQFAIEARDTESAAFAARAYTDRLQMLVRLGMLDDIHRSRSEKGDPGVDELERDIRELEAMAELTPN